MLSAVRKAPPQVTGISPKEGPPGTRVTIRGENLGVDNKDLIALRICGVDCLLAAEWCSPSKIIARTGSARGKGEVIVVTKSGGVGSCTVNFRGYVVQTGPLQESAVWVDESQTWSTMLGRGGHMSPMLSPDSDDPLGISDESNEKKFPETELHEMFPEGSGSTSAENFEPEWFLLENHHGTSFDDLKAGLAYLRRKAAHRHEGPQTFLKNNLSTFMDCQYALEEMHEVLTEDLLNCPDGVITQQLERTLNKANNSADALFHDVLGRKDRADSTRSALGVLNRFKFLFNLPGSIDKNIKKEDYDLVITDYSRAKSLFGETEIALFKKVYQEVENRICAFRDMLYTKLMSLPASVDEQKRLVRYLMHLGTDGDPAWECLCNRKNWTSNLLYSCMEQHLVREKTDLESEPDTVIRVTTKLTSSGWRSGGKSPARVQFVELLSNMLAEQLPELWRLGQAYFTGKLLKQVHDQPAQIHPSKHSEFKGLVMDVITSYCNLIRGAYLPDSLQSQNPTERGRYGIWPENKRDSPGAWLPVCNRFIRSCVASLGSLELHADSVQVLQTLVFDMRVSCVKTLLNQAVQGVQVLPERESWNVDEDDEKGGTTQLPMLFENLVNETLQFLQEVLQSRPGEYELFQARTVQKETAELCAVLLQSFASTLEQLAMFGNADKPSNRDRRSQDIQTLWTGEALPALDQRLLIMLSNCRHTRLTILPRLLDTMEKYGYPDVSNIVKGSEACYSNLEDLLFQKYVEEKANPIVGSLETNMNAGHWEWNDCPPPNGVKSYIKEALMSLIEVHAEVQQLAPSLVPSLLQEIVSSVVEEVSRLVQCIHKFTGNGTLQAWLDLLVLQYAINPYQTDQSSLALKEACEFLPALKRQDDNRKLDELLNEFKAHMSFQLLCFYGDQKSTAVDT